MEKNLDKFPGILFNFTQPTAHNLDELISGVKAQIAIKIHGEDFFVLQEKSIQIKDVISTIKGGADVQIEQFTGQKSTADNIE